MSRGRVGQVCFVWILQYFLLKQSVCWTCPWCQSTLDALLGPEGRSPPHSRGQAPWRWQARKAAVSVLGCWVLFLVLGALVMVAVSSPGTGGSLTHKGKLEA